MAVLIALWLNASNLSVWPFIAFPLVAALIAAVCKPMSWMLSAVLGMSVSIAGAVAVVAYAVSKI